MIAKLLIIGVPFGLVAVALAHVATLITAIEHAIRIVPK